MSEEKKKKSKMKALKVLMYSLTGQQLEAIAVICGKVYSGNLVSADRWALLKSAFYSYFQEE